MSKESHSCPRSLYRVALIGAALFHADCSGGSGRASNQELTSRQIDSTDSVSRSDWAETARYRQLLRSALTAEDKKSAVEATGCEIGRVLNKLGVNPGDAALKQAQKRTYRTHADSLARERADSELAFKEIVALKDPVCDSIRATWAPLDTTDDRYIDSHP